MINNNWQVLGVGLMDCEKSHESSPAILQESICPYGYDRSPKILHCTEETLRDTLKQPPWVFFI